MGNNDKQEHQDPELHGNQVHQESEEDFDVLAADSVFQVSPDDVEALLADEIETLDLTKFDAQEPEFSIPTDDFSMLDVNLESPKMNEEFSSANEQPLHENSHEGYGPKNLHESNDVSSSAFELDQLIEEDEAHISLSQIPEKKLSSSNSSSEEFQSTEVPLKEQDLNEEQVLKTKGKLPLWKKVLIGVGVFFVLVFVLTLITSGTSDQVPAPAAVPGIPTENNPSGTKELPEPDDTQLHGGLFNAFESEKQSIESTDSFVNSDKTTVSTLTNIQQQYEAMAAKANSLSLQLKTEQETSDALRIKITELQGSKDTLSRENLSLRNEIQDVNAKLNDEHKLRVQREQQIDTLTKELVIANKTIENLNEKKSLIEADLDRERARVEKMVSADSDGLKNVESQLEALRIDFNKKYAAKSKTDANAMLSELKLVSIDPTSGVGKFLKMKNGKAIGELKLEAGENLIGRGRVSSIDMWGCIFFEDGAHYEPLNGFCK